MIEFFILFGMDILITMLYLHHEEKNYGDLNNINIIFLEFNKIIEIHEVGAHKKGVMISGDGKGERLLGGYTCQIILIFPFF